MQIDTKRSGARRWLFTLGAGLLLTGAAAAQELPPELGGANPRQELEELFKKVEKRLVRMSELLGQAGAGDTGALKGLGGAGIDELIRAAERPPASAGGVGIGALIEATQGHGRELLQEIDRVLEIAREQSQQQQQQQQQSGSGNSSQSPQQSGGQQPQQGQSPENSQQMQGERAPRPGGEQQEQQPQPQGEDPRGNQSDPSTSPQQQGGPPPGAEQGLPSGAEDGGQWGDLPVHVRKVFRNGVGADVPPQYRDWIDAYHKKLSTRAPR